MLSGGFALSTANAVVIPLRRRAGAVVGSTVVDADDAERLIAWRWAYLSAAAGRGYAIRYEQHDGQQVVILMHRQVMGLPPVPGRTGPEVDHIDGNGLNNCRANLRVVTHAQNMQNRTKSQASISGHRNVYWSARKRRWRVEVKLNGQRKHYGYFKDKDQAALTASAIRAELMPYSADAQLATPSTRTPDQAPTLDRAVTKWSEGARTL